jgi:alkanesulfonate monooxygenase SsuD/methylene tetrahydromethanopterin reductase-like flavin-dependent oxidoreductase (luciferase family)
MQVGLFLDMRNPPQWERPWAAFYGDALDRIVEAEQLGIDSVWLTEHHFFEDGYLPQPLTFAAAIAGRTSRIRIGTAVLIAGLRSPLEIAEQAGLVDLISAGRMELGLGAGYRVPEFDAYGQDIGHRYTLLEQRAEEVVRLWEQGGFTPPPAQEKAPLWIGAHGPRGARLAGRLAAGMLSFNREAHAVYRSSLEQAGHDLRRARVTGLANMVIASDPEAAWPRIRPHLAYQWGSYARYGAEGAESRAGATAKPLATLTADVDPETLRSPGPDMTQPNFDVVTPDEAIRRITTWLSDLPVDTVYFWASIAGMPDDLARRHVELLATQVAPALKVR